MTYQEKFGLYRAFESIKNQASNILEGISVWNTNYVNATREHGAPYIAAEQILSRKITETESLINSFNGHKKEFTALTNNKLRTLSFESEITNKVGPARAVLRELIVECDKAIGILDEAVSPIPSSERDKLESLRKELKEISTKVHNIDFEKNLEEAIEECEKGDHLASWLITGRVVRYILDKIPGKNIEEKTKFLKEEGIVSSENKETINFIFKTDRETRNIASHTISPFPQPKDTISLLADSLKLLELT